MSWSFLAEVVRYEVMRELRFRSFSFSSSSALVFIFGSLPGSTTTSNALKEFSGLSLLEVRWAAAYVYKGFLNMFSFGVNLPELAAADYTVAFWLLLVSYLRG